MASPEAPEGPPEIVYGSVVDYYGASMVAMGISAALVERAASGHGQYADRGPDRGYPVAGRYRGFAHPVQFGSTPGPKPLPSPTFGQHAADILTAHGYSKARTPWNRLRRATGVAPGRGLAKTRSA
jgi:crotonobetainyl-CoA:carnitine CoA-transferase CaiB-like acyl-CoA transferase